MGSSTRPAHAHFSTARLESSALTPPAMFSNLRSFRTDRRDSRMSTGLILSRIEQAVAIVTLNRPDVLNALSLELMGQLVEVLEKHDADPFVRCIVLNGSDRAFAAGA